MKTNLSFTIDKNDPHANFFVRNLFEANGTTRAVVLIAGHSFKVTKVGSCPQSENESDYFFQLEEIVDDAPSKT